MFSLQGESCPSAHIQMDGCRGAPHIDSRYILLWNPVWGGGGAGGVNEVGGQLRTTRQNTAEFTHSHALRLRLTQPCSETQTHTAMLRLRLTHSHALRLRPTQPCSETQTHTQPCSETENHTQPCSETQTHTAVLWDWDSHSQWRWSLRGFNTWCGVDEPPSYWPCIDHLNYSAYSTVKYKQGSSIFLANSPSK